MFDSSLISTFGHRFWYQLSCFAYVVHFKSYSKAADCLELSQSSLTKAVQALETQLKVPLLFRGGRRSLALTPEGDQMYARSVELLKGLADLKQCLYGLDRQQHYTLRLALPDWIFCDYLFEPLMRFKKRYSGIKIAFETPKDLDSTLEHSTGSTLRLTIDPCAGWVQKLLLKRRLGLYASADYLKNYVLPQHLQDLNQHRVLYWKSEDAKLCKIMTWHRLARSLGELGSYSSAALFKMAHMGLGVLSWVKDARLREQGLIEFAQTLSQDYAPVLKVYFECSAVDWPQPWVQALYQCLAVSLRPLNTIPNWNK